MIKEYNTRMHSTTKVTPNEAFYQKYITTKRIREDTPEQIRQRVTHNIKMVGSDRNKGCVNELSEGDRVIVKNTMRIKIRADGTRLIIPAAENKRTCRVGFNAFVHKIRGNCIDLKWA